MRGAEEKPSKLDVAAELAGTGYVHVRKLAEGGMGEVHVVRHGLTGEERVMKLVLPMAPDAAELVKKRTIAEGRTLQKLEHPHILRLIELGVTAGGRPWLVTEFLRGRTLKEEVDLRGPLPWPEVAQILRDVLSALGYAHKHGVVHRDIKPLNLFYCDDEGVRRVKVLDFGIAKLLSDEAKMQAGSAFVATAEGYFVGSPTFMPPEQIGGNVTAMSDVYTLAGTGVYLLTANYPYPGSTPEEVLTGHMIDPPPNVKKVRPDVPDVLADLLRVGLAKVPEERESVAKMISTLDALLAEEGRRIAQGVSARGTVRMPGSPSPPAVALVGDALAQPPAATMPMGESPAVAGVSRRTKAFDVIAPAAKALPKMDPQAERDAREWAALERAAAARDARRKRVRFERTVFWGGSVIVVFLLIVIAWQLWTLAGQWGWRT
jgi:eukaryotic-like serine/threonine-protein kinase